MVPDTNKERDMKKCALFTIVLLVASCDSQGRVVAVAADENGGFTATLPDGTEVAGEDAYDAAIAPQVEPIEAMRPMVFAVTTSTKADGGAKGLTLENSTRQSRSIPPIWRAASIAGSCISRSR